MKDAFLKTSQVITDYIVDSETGEILDTNSKSIKYIANTKESFFLAYTSILGVLRQLSLPEVRLYCYLLENYNIGTLIALSRHAKEFISKEIGIAPGTISNSLIGLVEKKLLYRLEGKGVYKLNPRYAFKGGSKDRNNALKFTIEVECPDC